MMLRDRVEFYVRAMTEIAANVNDDPEAAHGNADDLLCKFLKELGYKELVDAYESIQPKWYA